MGLFVSVWADFPKLMVSSKSDRFLWDLSGVGWVTVKIVTLTKQGMYQTTFVNRTWCFSG